MRVVQLAHLPGGVPRAHGFWQLWEAPEPGCPQGEYFVASSREPRPQATPGPGTRRHSGGWGRLESWEYGVPRTGPSLPPGCVPPLQSSPQVPALGLTPTVPNSPWGDLQPSWSWGPRRWQQRAGFPGYSEDSRHDLCDSHLQFSPAEPGAGTCKRLVAFPARSSKQTKNAQGNRAVQIQAVQGSTLYRAGGQERKKFTSGMSETAEAA